MKVADTNSSENVFNNDAGGINQVEEKTISLFSINMRNFLSNHLAVFSSDNRDICHYYLYLQSLFRAS